VSLAISAALASGLGRQSFDPPDGPAAGVGPALASILSRLGGVAIIFGLLGGVEAMVGGRATAGIRGWLARVSVPAALGFASSLLMWLVAQILAGGRLGGAGSLVLLMLGSGAGTALGLLIASLSPRPVIGWAATLLLVIPVWILGGEGQSWLNLPGWAKTVAAINPARWTFEGLMLNASDRLPVQVADSDPPTDLAEPYFPAETDRIGPRGAALALVAMMLGWGAAAAFIATSPRSEPPDGRPAP
jgi:hypothetical protein